MGSHVIFVERLYRPFILVRKIGNFSQRIITNRRKNIQNRPKIAHERDEKLTIIVLGLERNYYVMVSPDVKMRINIRV